MMSVLEPRKHLPESEATVCPSCKCKLIERDMSDVDTDDDFVLYDFHCKNCNCMFVIKKPHRPDDWEFWLETPFWKEINKSRKTEE